MFHIIHTLFQHDFWTYYVLDIFYYCIQIYLILLNCYKLFHPKENSSLATLLMIAIYVASIFFAIINCAVSNICAYIFLCMSVSVYVELIPGSGKSGLRGRLTCKMLKDREKLPSKNDWLSIYLSLATHKPLGFSLCYQ